MSAASLPTPRRARAERRPASPAPDPDRLARLLVQVWLEVQHGRRPFSQLSPLVTPALRRRLFAQLPRRPVLGGAPRIRVARVIACFPASDVFEASVLVEQDERTTAVAVRLERHRGAWRAVELTAPEQGLTPLTTASLPRPTGPPRDAFDEVLEGDTSSYVSRNRRPDGRRQSSRP